MSNIIISSKEEHNISYLGQGVLTPHLILSQVSAQKNLFVCPCSNPYKSVGGSVGFGVVGESGSLVGSLVTGVLVGRRVPTTGALVGWLVVGRTVGCCARSLQGVTKAQQKCSGSSHSLDSPEGQGWWQFFTTSFQSSPRKFEQHQPIRKQCLD